jgi:peptidoglycan/xylan/chitin deacetylase (PgdA/CDA1 family)
MPAAREAGRMDNRYYDWSPLPSRPPLRWPDGAHVALCVIVSLEQIEWLPGADTALPPSLVRFGPYPEVLDVHELSHHEYGNRVGVFRVLDVLDRHGITATAAVDAALARGNRYVVERCLERGYELIAHGLSASRAITEDMGADAERAYIAESLQAVADVAGRPPRGWLSPDYAESTRTVALLAEAGVRYVCDWPTDEQPYRMTVPDGEMFCLPVTLDADEVVTHRLRGVAMDRWLGIVSEAFDRLYEDGAQSGRLLILNVHPYLMGQPFRIRYLDRALTHVLGHERVWVATAGEIVDWYAEQAG